MKSACPLLAYTRAAMITKTDFIAAIGRVHANTYAVAAVLNDNQLGWRPRAGEFTVAELVLHIANARLLPLQILVGEPTRYRGHTPRSGETAEHLRQTILRTGKKTIAGLHSADLEAVVPNLRGVELPGWRIALNALVEHEVHHRSQLCAYLSAMGVEAPALFDMHVEELPI
jgi:uncharacterized damage-inducible protein DinB